MIRLRWLVSKSRKTLTIVQKHFERPNLLHFFARQRRPIAERQLILTLLLRLDRSPLYSSASYRASSGRSNVRYASVWRDEPNKAGEFLSASELLKLWVVTSRQDRRI